MKSIERLLTQGSTRRPSYSDTWRQISDDKYCSYFTVRSNDAAMYDKFSRKGMRYTSLDALHTALDVIKRYPAGSSIAWNDDSRVWNRIVPFSFVVETFDDADTGKRYCLLSWIDESGVSREIEHDKILAHFTRRR